MRNFAIGRLFFLPYFLPVAPFPAAAAHGQIYMYNKECVVDRVSVDAIDAIAKC
jgi:hypothetical protein